MSSMRRTSTAREHAGLSRISCHRLSARPLPTPCPFTPTRVHAEPGLVRLVKTTKEIQAARSIVSAGGAKNLIEEGGEAELSGLGVGVAGGGREPDGAGLDEQPVVALDMHVDERDRAKKIEARTNSGHDAYSLHPTGVRLGRTSRHATRNQPWYVRDADQALEAHLVLPVPTGGPGGFLA